MILPLLTAVVWLGPLRSAVQRLEAERLQHIDRAEKLGIITIREDELRRLLGR